MNIAFADGRIVSSPVRRTGGMWTPEFPRMPGAETSRNGLPLTTLDVKHQTDRRARDAILVELDGVIRAGASPTSPEVRTWSKRTIDDIEQWLARIARTKCPSATSATSPCG